MNDRHRTRERQRKKELLARKRKLDKKMKEIADGLRMGMDRICEQLREMAERMAETAAGTLNTLTKEMTDDRES